MTVKIDNAEPNVFPAIEAVDARDSGRDAEVSECIRFQRHADRFHIDFETRGIALGNNSGVVD